jgi:hypothetical protein
MIENPVKDLEGGGTWGLKKGQVLLFYHLIDPANISDVRFSLSKISLKTAILF